MRSQSGSRAALALVILLREPSGLTLRLMSVKVPLVLLCAATLAACAPNAAPVTRTPVATTTVGALACPKAVPVDKAMKSRVPWVPAAPRGLDGSARLAPRRVPARVVICAYIGHVSPAGKSGSVLLAGDLKGVMSDLAWIPPTPQPGACLANLALSDGDYYLIGLSYPGSTQWVAAPRDHCAGSSNGVFSSGANLSVRTSAWYKAGHWTSTGSSDVCQPYGSGWGRLGQQSSMVPGHPVSVSVCEGSAAGGGKATQRTETLGVDSLASALGALPASASKYQFVCKPLGPPSTWYTLLFGYVEGPPVVVSVEVGCTPAIDNGSLQANDATTVLPLIHKLLRQR